MTLKMASTQLVELSVANNSPSQDSGHPDARFQSGNGTSFADVISIISL